MNKKEKKELCYGMEGYVPLPHQTTGGGEQLGHVREKNVKEQFGERTDVNRTLLQKNKFPREVIAGLTVGQRSKGKRK